MDYLFGSLTGFSKEQDGGKITAPGLGYKFQTGVHLYRGLWTEDGRMAEWSVRAVV